MNIFLKKDRLNRGFTILELIISLTIILLIFSIVVVYSDLKKDVILKTESQNIISVLDLAQSMSKNSISSSSYGILLYSDSYTLFKGAVHSSSSPDNVIYNIDDNIELTNINIASSTNNSVVFKKITGETDNLGSFDVKIKDSVKFKAITIGFSGKAGILGPDLLPTGNRIYDARHVHFDYAQDISSSVTLVLDFGSGITETINFQDFFDTWEFNWSGTIDVGGSDQVLEIFTHNADPFSSEFSIVRDMRYNTGTLDIYLDGEHLISYDALGNVSKGLSIFAGDPQIQ